MDGFKPDDRIGPYRIVRFLGAGGMGRVYEARHVHLGTTCALKVFAAESGKAQFLRKRFLAEGKVLARLRHPRIVHVSDLGIDEATDTPYFAMDLVLSPDGTPKTLEDIRREGVDEVRVAEWFADLCEGLDYIHGEGVVHRDVKLENVLIGPDGRAVISDFGISRIFGEDLRRSIDLTSVTFADDGMSAIRMGTGAYMAPELKSRQTPVAATPASDAWALGVLVFRLLTGVWYEPQTRLLDMLGVYELPWAKLIGRLCAVNPEDRLGGKPFSDLAVELKPPQRKRFPWAICVFGLVALMACCCAFFCFTTSRGGSEGAVFSSVERPAEEILEGARSGKTEDMVLAEMYRDGKGVGRDYAKSVDLYLQAIEKQSFDAVGGIGTMYEHGWGVTNNPHVAYLMYLIAAGNGVSNSVQDVIRCYEGGIGVGRNQKEANLWRRREILIPLEKKARDELAALKGPVYPTSETERRKKLAEINPRWNSSKLAKIGEVVYKYGILSNGTVCVYTGGRCNDKQSGFRPRNVHGDLTIPEVIESRPVTEIGIYAFYSAANLESVAVPPSVKSIKDVAFSKCEKLSKVSLPEGLLEIGDYAFYDSRKLHGVALPHSVTNIGVLAFYPAPPAVSEDHPRFALKDGALYSKDRMTLLAYYGSNETFTVAAGTKHIAKYAFVNAYALKEIILPETLETIADYAFGGCSSLASMIIPQGVTNIGHRAFSQCPALSAVYYQGRIPHVADDMYDGCGSMFSFVKRGRGWEDELGILPSNWPDDGQKWMDADLLRRGNSRSWNCHVVRYWENGKVFGGDEIISMRLEMLRAEATRGNISAMKELAWRYEWGIDGVKKDIGEAVKFLEGVANGGGDGDAMCKIGDFYQKGINGKRNYAEAVRWYRTALGCGGLWSMRACQELANMYRNGLGVEKDEETAFLLTFIAAVHGMTGAQCVLSDCYEKGIGVAPNRKSAAYWSYLYVKAVARRNSERAKRKIVELESR